MSNNSNIDVAPLHSYKKRSVSGACMSTLSRNIKRTSNGIPLNCDDLITSIALTILYCILCLSKES